MGAMCKCCPDKKSHLEVSGVTWVPSLAGQETLREILNDSHGAHGSLSEGKIVWERQRKHTSALTQSPFCFARHTQNAWDSLRSALTVLAQISAFCFRKLFTFKFRMSYMSPLGPDCLQNISLPPLPLPPLPWLNFSIHRSGHCSFSWCFHSGNRWRLNFVT